MKAKRLLGTILAGGLGLLAVTASGDVLAQGKKKPAQAAPPAVAAVPPTTKKPIELKPVELKFGLNHKQVAEVVDTVLDADYKPKYQSVSPGVKMKALDAELAEEKNKFRRSRIDFGKLPTGVDATPLKGEYTYLNKESMMTLVRPGHPKRTFFFIQDKLWKVIDDYTLGEGNALGSTYQEAVVKLATKKYGVPGRVLDADYNIGRNAMEVDWKDANIHVRVIQRGDAALAIAYEDNGTLANLSAMRPNKPVQDSGIDPAVAAAVRGDPIPAAPASAAPPEKNKQK